LTTESGAAAKAAEAEVSSTRAASERVRFIVDLHGSVFEKGSSVEIKLGGAHPPLPAQARRGDWPGDDDGHQRTAPCGRRPSASERALGRARRTSGRSSSPQDRGGVRAARVGRRHEHRHGR
jgi:hypothetical protein